MNSFLSVFLLLTGSLLILTSCEEIRSYPETPEVNYKGFNLFKTTDALGNDIIIGQLEFEFVDGDGNIGNEPPGDTIQADSLKYNLFLSLYDFDRTEFRKVENLSSLNFRIPYIERQGQNKTLQGTVTVDLEYKTIKYDTIFYTFYIQDRDFNHSNTDTTEVIILAGFEEEVSDSTDLN